MKKTTMILIVSVLLISLMSTCISAVGFARIWSDNEHGSYLAEYAGDGDTEKFWHTDWENGITEPPYKIYFELDGTYNITSLGLLPRQDANLNGLIYVFNVYVSEDGENYTLVKEVDDFVNDYEIQTVTFASPVKAKFIQIEALETEGTSFASLNELEVTGELAAEAVAAEPEKEPEVTVAEQPAEPEAPIQTDPVTVSTEAPLTSDIIVILFAVFAASVILFVSVKKRFAVK